METYKRKLENLGDLKRQMKLLEENNMIYMQNTVSLEEELRKANAARAQLETYKRQVREGNLHAKMKLIGTFRSFKKDCIDAIFCLPGPGAAQEIV